MSPDEGPEYSRLLRAIRSRRSWTQQQLAEALSVSKRTIQAWEAGDSGPNTRDMPMLRGMLGDLTSSLAY